MTSPSAQNRRLPQARRSLAAAIAVAFGATVAGAEGEVLERTFDVAPGQRVVVDTDVGAVDIETWDDARIRVVVENADALDDVQFDQADGTVTVRGVREGGWWAFWNWTKTPHFRLNVPYVHNVEVRAGGGHVAIDRLQGDFVARTSGGDVRVGDVDGPVRAKTSGGSVRIGTADETVAATSGGSIRVGETHGGLDATTSGGSITADAVAGDLAAKTSGGSINIGSVGGAVRARTSGGSISAAFAAQPNAASELRTSGGNVTVYMPDDIAVDIDARTSGGRVTSDFNVVGEIVDRNRLEASLNGGGPAMSLRTSGGSIRLRRMAP